MRKPLVLFGFLVLIAGLLPYLKQLPFLSFLAGFPTEGDLYYVIIIALGALTLYFGIKK